MFFRRGVSGEDAWLQAKIWLFSIGAMVALLGMGLENDWLIGAAGIILLIGFVLRFFDRGGEEEEPT